MVSTFNLKLLKKERLTEDVFKYIFASSEQFSYQPGQFLTFMIEQEEGRKPRSYSILDYDAEKKEVHFIIKLVSGGVAGEVFRKMELGQEFEVKGPLGHFVFNNDNPEQWFIGCGCGLSPLHNILQNNLTKFPEKKFVLLFSVKKKSDLLFHEELKQLEQEHANFTYIPTLTREEWEGKRGRVQNHFPENFENKTYYICGIKELIVGVKELLLEKGVDPKNIHFERYS